VTDFWRRMAAVAVAAFGAGAAFGDEHPSFVKAEDVPGLPRVLLIGDSISMQYTLRVRELLSGVANVHRPARNCRSTRQTLAELDDYLGDGRWDVIHFNWGIHDLTLLDADGKVAPPPEGKHQVPLDTYRENVRALADRLQRTGAKLIWATTTPMGSKIEAKGYRWDRDVAAYNAAAAEALRGRDIAVNDLYSLIKPRAEELLSDGVHFKPEGVEVLAPAVADAVRGALAPAARAHAQ